jgi:energy-coupling factor transport system substrate-specific component
MVTTISADSGIAPWTPEDICAGLAALRAAAHDMSFGQIATEITRHRIASGMKAAQASVSRSTVYACFKPGRTRYSAALVAEIVTVLTDDTEAAALWRQRCLAVNRGNQMAMLTAATEVQANTPATTEADEAHEAVEAAAEAEATAQIAALAPAAKPGLGTTVLRAENESAQGTSNIRQATQLENPLITANGRTVFGGRPRWATDALGLSPQVIALVLFIGVIVNVVPHVFSVTLFGTHFPLFMDMIGTAIVALVLGPLWAVLVGVLSALITLPIVQLGALPLLFTPVVIIGALAWGLGIHRFKMGTTLLRFITLNLLVGAICTATAVIIVFATLDGQTLMPVAEHMADSVVTMGVPRFMAVLFTNLTLSVADKMLAGIVALIATSTVLRKYAPPAVGNTIAHPDKTSDTNI